MRLLPGSTGENGPAEWDEELIDDARARGAEFAFRVVAKGRDGRWGVVCHHINTIDPYQARDSAKRMAESWGRGAMVEHRALVGPPRFLEGERPAVEAVTLADGPAVQSLVPGVLPVPDVTRHLQAERQRRDARRGDAPLPAGSLWDEAAIKQQELFQ